MYYEILQEEVKEYKVSEKGVKSMCKIMEELRQEGIQEGKIEGRIEGIQTLIETYNCEFNIPKNIIVLKIADKFKLSDSDAKMYVDKYYK